MSNIIAIKRSKAAGSSPTSLELGELAVNTSDKSLWVGDGLNVVQLVDGTTALARVKCTYSCVITASGVIGTVVTTGGGVLTRTAKGKYRFTCTSGVKDTDSISIRATDNIGIDETAATPNNIDWEFYDPHAIGHPLVDPTTIKITIIG